MSIQDEVRAWAARNKAFAASGEAARRMAICQECPHHAWALGIWCKLCGCNMHVKTSLPNATCPDVPARW